MRRFPLGRRSIGIILVIALFALSGITADSIRPEVQKYQPPRRIVYLPGFFFGAAVFAGFGPVVADVLWVKCDEYWSSGRWYRMWPLMRAINMLNPHWVDAYRFTGWHAAYNLYAAALIEADNLRRQAEEFRKRGCVKEAEELERKAKLVEKEKEYWLQEGLKVLKEGVYHNPKSWEMVFELGWTYYDKVQDYGKAARYLEMAAQLPKRPFYVIHMIAHAYERLPDIEKALYWWTVALVLREQGENPTAVPIGATTTIKQWYVRAWKLYKQGRYKEALEALIKDKLVDDPVDLIGLHFLAKIYEAMGDLRKARDAWAWCKKHNIHDHYAERMMRRIERMMREKKMKVPKGFPERPPWEEGPPQPSPEKAAS